MPNAFQRFVRRVAEGELLGRLLDQLPEPHRQTLADLREHLRAHGRLPRPELVRRRPIAGGQVVGGAAVVLGDVREGGHLLGVNVLRGRVEGTLRGANIVLGDVRGGTLRGVNLIVGDVHEGYLRGVNVLLGDIHGGEVRCNIVIGDIHAGLVEAEVHIGQELGGAVTVAERVHIHEHEPAE